MEIVYDNISETVLRDMIALKAAVEPRLMRERRTVKRHERVTALAGICSLGWTWRLSAEISPGGNFVGFSFVVVIA